MAKNIVKKSSLSIEGILSVENEKIFCEVEGYAEPVNLATILEEFNGQDVTISINNTEELA